MKCNGYDTFYPPFVSLLPCQASNLYLNPPRGILHPRAVVGRERIEEIRKHRAQRMLTRVGRERIEEIRKRHA